MIAMLARCRPRYLALLVIGQPQHGFAAFGIGFDMNKLHDLMMRLAFFIEGEWLYYRKYLPELINWLFFALVLGSLCFTLGFAVGYWRYG